VKQASQLFKQAEKKSHIAIQERKDAGDWEQLATVLQAPANWKLQ
jgi:hypothetical protein